MTDTDVRRIHERLDEIVESIHNLSLANQHTSNELSALVASLAKSEATRAATCPHAPAIARMQAQMRIVVWIGGLLVVALLIPGIQWFGARLFALVFGGG